MRIATFNLLNGRSLSDGRVDVDRLAAAVRTLDADVLGLQEVDRNQPRSHRADLTAVAADAMGALAHRFVPALAGTPGGTWTMATGEEPEGSTGYGIALLSRHPVLSWHVVRLPALHIRVPLWVPSARRPILVRDEPRVAVAAVLETPSGPLTVVTTHLSFVPGWNGRQLRRVVGELAELPRPLVVTGDLNMGPGPAARITGLRPLATVPTFPAEHPRRQIDHLLTDDPLHATGPGQAVQLPLSDHRALVVDCTLG